MKIFVKEEVNTGRQVFLDVAKTIAIFGMVLSHIILVQMYGSNPMQLGATAKFITLMLLGGVFAAPVFMFSMGTGIAYSSHTTSEYQIHRGIDLTIKAWVLNIIRFPLPLLLIWYFTRNTEFSKIILGASISLDILHFAGLAFIFFAIFKFFELSPKKVLIVAIILALIASAFREFTTGNLIADFIVGHFMGIKNTMQFKTCFPVFHWLIFVAGGYYFGDKLKHCVSKDRFFAIALPVSLLIFAGYIIYSLPRSFGMFANDDSYYHMHILDMIFAFSSIFLMSSVCHFASKIIPGKLLNIFASISKNINEIYIQQWVIIGWFILILTRTILNITFSLPIVLLLTIGIIIVSEIFARLFKSAKKHFKNSKPDKF